MGKIIGLSNTEDALWYRFPANDETINGLDIVFEIQDLLFHSVELKNPAYKDYLKQGRGENHFIIENQDILAYFIFTKSNAHLILRKTLKWQEYQKAIDKVFDFIK
ncbi:MAG: hypothetical protein ACP5NS_00640 [Candidatus Pacearchaeota archaeon]